MHYRLDKIANLVLTNEVSSEFDCNMDATQYAHKKFFMFSDDNLYVTFRFHIRILDYMIEMFGKDIVLKQTDKDHIETTVNINQTGAILLVQQYLDAIEIVYPENLRRDMLDRLSSSYKKYQS